MLSRTRDVLKNRNKIEKELKTRQKNEIARLKDKSAFKAKLFDDLKQIEVILNDPDIEAVRVTIPDKKLPLFSAAIYDEDLASYEVTQVEGESNQFYIRRRLIAF